MSEQLHSARAQERFRQARFGPVGDDSRWARGRAKLLARSNEADGVYALRVEVG